jgi:hypothetical protein
MRRAGCCCGGCTVSDGDSSESVTLEPVSTNADGSYTFTDTPPTAGAYTYMASWTGNTTAGAVRVSRRVTVTPGIGATVSTR